MALTNQAAHGGEGYSLSELLTLKAPLIMRLVLAATFLVALATVAQAQTTSTPGTAAASNTVNVMAVGNVPSSDGSGTGTDGVSHIQYSGHQYSTPSVQGSYFAGANPCLIGVGASGAGGPIGLSLTLGRNDEGCTRRSDAAAWHALGHDEIAMARMCQDENNADAFFAATGLACPGSQNERRYKLPNGSLAPIAAMGPRFASNSGPTPAAYQPSVPNPAIAAQPTPNQVATTLPTDAAFLKPEWCSRAKPQTEASQNYFASVCH